MKHTILIALLFTLVGCNSPYYKALEAVGIHKRDILIDRVKDGKKSQQEAKEQFQSALEKFTELTQFDGGDLQDIYDKLNRELERSEDKAKAVHSRIEAIEDVSDELFGEWKKELKTFENEEYKRISLEKYKATQAKYEALIRAMKQAEKSIKPVLATFSDQVLFLKHNLNAQAIASLDAQTEMLKGDISTLIERMESSIAEADAFIESMNQS